MTYGGVTYLLQLVQLTCDEDSTANVVLVQVLDVDWDHRRFQTENIILQAITDIIHGHFAQW